jgi:hypothetical protein
MFNFLVGDYWEECPTIVFLNIIFTHVFFHFTWSQRKDYGKNTYINKIGGNW